MHRTWLYIIVILCITGCAAPQQEPRARLTVAEALGGGDTAGFARATEPRPFVFPQDHGPHPEFATEWWYYTGNLAAVDGRRFGYQFTIFRFGMAPNAPERASDWAANSIYMAHFALSDVANNNFYFFERFSRGAAGLAGATADPFRVWLEDWQASGLGPTGTPMRLQATDGAVALDLTLEQGKPTVLQGDRGLSQKSAEAGNASYYYSITRMPTSGTLTIDGTPITVTGNSWMDREWSTSVLGADQVGWDWFALQLADGRDVMYYQLRRIDGTPDPLSKGIIVNKDGSSTVLRFADVQLETTNTWRSPHTNANYPAGWRLRVPSQQVDIAITPQIADQELRFAITYWEGTVRLSDGGYGYVEMTGYAEADKRR